MKKERRPKPVIGWREWVSLPDLGVEAIKAKVDTGARTSSLHAFEIRLVRRRGKEYVRFKIHPLQRSHRGVVEAEAEVADRRPVRSSTGHVQERVVIRTTLGIGEDSRPIELTLTSRDAMGFRMLLGREAIRGRYTVDPGRSFRSAKKKIPTRAPRRGAK